MPSGIYLVGSRAGDRRNLMTANWVTQVSREPKLVAVSVEKDAVTHELIASGRSFAISIIDREDRSVVRKFVKPVGAAVHDQTLAGVAIDDAVSTGSPVLASALGYLDCQLERSVSLGSHTLFIGEVVNVHLSEDAATADVLRMEDTRMNYGG